MTGAAPLREAVTAGTAWYGPSRVIAVPPDLEALRVAQRRLRSLFRVFPTVTIRDTGIQHEAGGLTFATLAMPGQQYGISTGRTKGGPLRVNQPIRVVTSVSPFGAGIMTARTSGGDWDPMAACPHLAAEPPGVIEQVTIKPEPHLQEWLTVNMLGGFLRALSAVPQAGNVRVFAHIPTPECRLYGYWLHRRGLMSEEALRSWLTAVGERHTALCEAFTRRIGGRAEVVCGSPLAWARWTEGAGLSEDWAAEAMAAAGDPLWKALAGHLEDSSLAAVVHASYAYAYLQEAFLAQEEGAALLIVENPDEWPVYPHSLPAADEAGADLRAARRLYIHPAMVPTSEGLYLYDLPLLAPRDHW